MPPNTQSMHLQENWNPNTRQIVKIAEWELEKISSWDGNRYPPFSKIAETELKLKQILSPIFVAISEVPFHFHYLTVWPYWTGLRTRIRIALEKLAVEGVGLSKKGLKKLEKEYAQKYGNRID